jgi:transcriptional regulator with XRE-family HTH domain
MLNYFCNIAALKMKHKEQLKEIGKYLFNARRDLNITQNEIYKRTGISKPTLLLMEKGTGNYSVIKLLIYLDAIDKDFKDIFAGV